MYGDSITTVPAADTGYWFNKGNRVSNPLGCGNGSDQGGSYFEPGSSNNGLLLFDWNMQFKVGAATGTLNGGAIPVPISAGDTDLTLNYKNILNGSISITLDGSEIAYGNFGNERMGYTLVPAVDKSNVKIVFSYPVATDGFYIIKFTQKL